MNFDEMLNYIYDNLEETNFKKLVIPNIIIETSVNKTHFKNIKSILKCIKRSPDDFMTFLIQDQPNSYWKTQSKSDGIIIENRLKKNQVCNIVQRYIQTNVLCKTCKSYDTILIKDNKLRLKKLVCKCCGSELILN
jgi:translation initiation factor 2 subunit 2